MKTHKDLEAWQNSIELVVRVYQLTEQFPKHEIYGLTNQVRRAAISVPSNIAEGAARKNAREFIQYLYVALGSLSELETQWIIAGKLDYIIAEDLENLNTRMTIIRSQISGLITHLSHKK